MSTTRHRSFPPRLVRALSIFLGCLLFIVFVAIFLVFLTDLIVVVRNSQFSQSGVTAQGIVVGVSGPGSGGKCHLSYAVQFTDRAGHVHTATISPCDLSAPSLSVGESITILYLPDNPTAILVATQLNGPGVQITTGFVIGLGCFDLILLASGIFWLLKASGLGGRGRPRSRQRLAGNHVIFALPTAGGHAQSEQGEQQQPASPPSREESAAPQATQAALFEPQDEQEELPRNPGPLM
ncbi:MAG TPA: DUF3592 domain-containing protein [Ktedonobacteraceae bacterium]